MKKAKNLPPYNSPLTWRKKHIPHDGSFLSQAAGRGLERLLDAYSLLRKLSPAGGGEALPADAKELRSRCEAAMCDDLNTPVVIAHLFDAVKVIHALRDGKAAIPAGDLEELKSVFRLFLEDLLGLPVNAADASEGDREGAYRKAVDLLLSIRRQAKDKRDWAASDRIRDELSAFGFEVKDTKDGFEWRLK